MLQDADLNRVFNNIENYTYMPPSYPAELPSKNHVPKHSFTPRIALSPQKFACEEKQNEQVHWNHYFFMSYFHDRVSCHQFEKVMFQVTR